MLVSVHVLVFRSVHVMLVPVVGSDVTGVCSIGIFGVGYCSVKLFG